MKTYKIVTLYYCDGTFAYFETRKGQSKFMMERALANADNTIGPWSKRVIIEEETSSE